jgi:hypothetical protein
MRQRTNEENDRRAAAVGLSGSMKEWREGVKELDAAEREADRRWREADRAWRPGDPL